MSKIVYPKRTLEISKYLCIFTLRSNSGKNFSHLLPTVGLCGMAGPAPDPHPREQNKVLRGFRVITAVPKG